MVCPHLIATARWYHLAQLRTFRACTISSWSGGIIQNWTEEGLPLPRSRLEPPCYLRMAYVVAWPSFLTCGFTALGPLGWRKGKMLDKNCRCSPWGAQLDKHLHSIESIVHYSSNLGGKWAASSCPCWQPASAMLQVLHHPRVQVADWHSSHVPGRRSHLWWRPQEESLRNWAAAPETSNCSVYSGCLHHKTPQKKKTTFLFQK